MGRIGCAGDGLLDAKTRVQKLLTDVPLDQLLRMLQASVPPEKVARRYFVHGYGVTNQPQWFQTALKVF